MLCTWIYGSAALGTRSNVLTLAAQPVAGWLSGFACLSSEVWAMVWWAGRGHSALSERLERIFSPSPRRRTKTNAATHTESSLSFRLPAEGTAAAAALGACLGAAAGDALGAPLGGQARCIASSHIFGRLYNVLQEPMAVNAFEVDKALMAGSMETRKYDDS